MFTPLWQSLAFQFDHQTLLQQKTSGRTLNTVLKYEAHNNHVGNKAKDDPSKHFSIVNWTGTGHED